MQVEFDRRKLFHLLRDFYTITGMRVGIYDRDCREIAAFPTRHSGFCKIIRSREEGMEHCRECDRTAFRRAQELGETHVYRCHAGLIEAVSPILSHGEALGFLMFGQMRGESDGAAQWKRLTESIAGLGLDAAYLEPAFYSLPAAGEEKAQACARILRACAVSVWLEGYVRVRREELPMQAEAYLRTHCGEPLSLERLAVTLGVGRTTLCAAVKREFGVTVGELLRSIRMEKAQELLEQTGEPVSVIAEQCGIADYNYFARVFHSQTGETPTAYRRRCSRN